MIFRMVLALLAIATLLISVIPPAAYAAGPIEMVSVDSGGNHSNAPSEYACISADGRYVAFESDATNLVAGDTNGVRDIFVHDRTTGVTTRVSVQTGGAEAHGGASRYPSISADGRYVAFESNAVDLVAGDTNGRGDIFVHDRTAGVTTRVSVQTGGAEANGGAIQNPSISASGRYVAFESRAADLVAGDINGVRDIFVHDCTTGATTLVSVSSGGSQSNAQSYDACISGDGRYVAFASDATNLVAGFIPGGGDIFLHDCITGATTLVSVSSGGAQGNNSSYYPSISSEGRYVAFESFASNLVTGDINVAPDVFLHDCITGATTLISVSSNGGHGDAASEYPCISADGRYISFESDATNLVAGDTNGKRDIFVHDRTAGAPTLVSVNASGTQADNDCYNSAISTSGQYVAFDSAATNLAPDGLFGIKDVFVVTLFSNTTAALVSTSLGGISFGVDAGSISSLARVRVADTKCFTPAGYDFPYGMFSFNISRLTAGQTVRVTIRVPRRLPADVKYYKCINNRLFDCTSLMTRIDDYTLVLALTDGGLGDADGQANGTIVDPGGPAVPIAASTTAIGQGTMTITQQSPVSLPSISVQSASLSATKVAPGNPVTVTANIANTGMVNGTSSVKVYVNGQEESSHGVTVSSGSNTPVTFTISRNEPGTYTVYVGGTSAGSFTVEQFTPDTILFISGAMVFFALVIGVLYMARRRTQG